MPVQDVAATHITTTVLFATSTGFNITEASGADPLLTVLSDTSLRIGQPRRAPTFTVTLQWHESFAGPVHNFAIYPGGDTTPGLPGDPCPSATTGCIAKTNPVSSSTPTTSKTFNLGTGRYEYYCEYHRSTMHGQIRAINPDVDGDGDVDIDDVINTFLNQFTTNLTYDIDLDGDVDIDDLIIVFLHQFI